MEIESDEIYGNERTLYLHDGDELADINAGDTIVHGVALGSGDITFGSSKKPKRWTDEALKEAADTLEGSPVVKNHSNSNIDDILGVVRRARHKPGVGVLYEADISDEDAAGRIRRGEVEVSPRVRHKKTEELDQDEDGTFVIGGEDIKKFDNLAVVTHGASPSNEISDGPSPQISSAEMALAFDHEPAVDATEMGEVDDDFGDEGDEEAADNPTDDDEGDESGGSQQGDEGDEEEGDEDDASGDGDESDDDGDEEDGDESGSGDGDEEDIRSKVTSLTEDEFPDSDIGGNSSDDESEEAMEPVDVPEDAIEELSEIEATPPQHAQKQAKKVLRWTEEHENTANTARSWDIVQSIAEGDELSMRELAEVGKVGRKKSDSGVSNEHKGQPWQDPGHVAYLAYGGDTGVNWAMRTIDRMRSSGGNELIATPTDTKISLVSSVDELGEPDSTPDTDDESESDGITFYNEL